MASNYVRFFHITFVLVFFAGTIVSMMAMIRAAKETEVKTVRTLTRMASNAQLFLVDAPLILVGVFGVLTAWKQDLPLTGTGWLNAAYAATALGLILGFFVMGGQARRAARLAQRDAESGIKSPELQAALSSPLPKIVGPALHGLVVYIIVLMVFQPF